MYEEICLIYKDKLTTSNVSVMLIILLNSILWNWFSRLSLSLSFSLSPTLYEIKQIEILEGSFLIFVIARLSERNIPGCTRKRGNKTSVKNVGGNSGNAVRLLHRGIAT